MAMGDLNCVEFGQAAHLSLALGAGAIKPSELLTLGTKPPRGDVSGGIIIDDLVVFEKVSRQAAALAGKGHSIGASRLRKAAAACEAENLILPVLLVNEIANLPRRNLRKIAKHRIIH